jgi:MSHA biogenesis protein MshL
MKTHKEKSMKWNVLAIAVAAVLAGCSSSYPRPDLSTQEQITKEMARISAGNASSKEAAQGKPSAMPAAVLSALVQSPEGTAVNAGSRIVRGPSAQRFDLVVSDAPIGQVLQGLVEGTDYSIMLKPATQSLTEAALGSAAGGGGGGAAVRTEAVEAASKRVSFKLKNITLFDALDAIRDVYGYDYSVEGRRIMVQPAELQTRLYYVNYILGQRRGVSDIQVIGGASVGQSSSTNSSTTSSTTSSYGSVQASGMSTIVKSDIWTEAEESLRTLLGCNIPKNIAANPLAVRPITTTTTGANASRADVSLQGEALVGERLRGVDGCTQGRALSINAMSGTILVRGMPTELRMVERMLKTMQINISRQVVIESKIIDVELSKDSQQGINWSQFNGGLQRLSVGGNANNVGLNQINPVTGQVGGTTLAGQAVTSSSAGTLGTTLGGLLGTSRSVQSAIGNSGGIALQATNFAALINFLESQGRVHVLSSPRIATLNNQKAVIKVGSEEPFVTNIVGGTSQFVAGSSLAVTNPTLTYQPFFSGIALDVTPQIDAEDNITLHVHSMVNRVTEKSKIALPDGSASVPFAVNTMNETDSVVKSRDGQVVVIGGLMSERNSDTRGGVPGVRDVPLAGSLFNFGSQQSSKRELVILLKTTVVKDDDSWANQISESETRINGMRATTP